MQSGKSFNYRSIANLGVQVLLRPQLQGGHHYAQNLLKREYISCQEGCYQSLYLNAGTKGSSGSIWIMPTETPRKETQPAAEEDEGGFSPLLSSNVHHPALLRWFPLARITSVVSFIFLTVGVDRVISTDLCSVWTAPTRQARCSERYVTRFAGLPPRG